MKHKMVRGMDGWRGLEYTKGLGEAAAYTHQVFWRVSAPDSTH